MLHDENNYTYFQYINSIVLFTNIPQQELFKISSYILANQIIWNRMKEKKSFDISNGAIFLYDFSISFLFLIS